MTTRLTFLPERLRKILTRITPERFVGVSGIAVLCAASAAALLPITHDANALALAQWIGGLGLNVLAGVLERTYLELQAQPASDELDRVGAVAQRISEEMRHYPLLRQQIGEFLGETGSLQIAQQVAAGNPAVSGWLLLQIYGEVSRYEEDFAAIHTALAEIKAALAAQGTRLGAPPAPYMAPGTPIQGVFGRSTDISLLTEWLALDSVMAQPIALRGLGGIGKTTLAATLAQQQQIREYFVDGVFWTELGPKPGLRARLEEWGQLLGLDLAAAPDITSCSRRLRETMDARRALLVIDDVWDAAQGTQFLVGGPACRIVITTRELPVANDLATPERVYAVDTLPPADAVALLRALAPGIVEADISKAKELCARLEFLPLAITLAGRYLANEALTAPRQARLITALLSSAEDRLALVQGTPRSGIEDDRPSLRRDSRIERGPPTAVGPGEICHAVVVRRRTVVVDGCNGSRGLGHHGRRDSNNAHASFAARTDREQAGSLPNACLAGRLRSSAAQGVEAVSEAQKRAIRYLIGRARASRDDPAYLGRDDYGSWSGHGRGSPPIGRVRRRNRTRS